MPSLLSIGLGTSLPPFFPENEPNFSFRINKTMQKRTQNEPKRTQLYKESEKQKRLRRKSTEFGSQRADRKAVGEGSLRAFGASQVNITG